MRVNRQARRHQVSNPRSPIHELSALNTTTHDNGTLLYLTGVALPKHTPIEELKSTTLDKARIRTHTNYLLPIQAQSMPLRINTTAYRSNSGVGNVIKKYQKVRLNTILSIRYFNLKYHLNTWSSSPQRSTTKHADDDSRIPKTRYR